MMEKQDITLTDQFITLSRMVMHRHHHMRGQHVHSPYHGQGRILSLLKMEPEMSQKKLSFLLGIRPQSIGELLAKLEQNGYITREQSDEDRRSLTIRLTTKGVDAASGESLQECEQKTDEVFNCLNEEEQKNLGSYLERVIASLQKTMKAEQGDFSEHHMHQHGRHMKFCGYHREKF